MELEPRHRELIRALLGQGSLNNLDGLDDLLAAGLVVTVTVCGIPDSRVTAAGRAVCCDVEQIPGAAT